MRRLSGRGPPHPDPERPHLSPYGRVKVHPESALRTLRSISARWVSQAHWTGWDGGSGFLPLPPPALF